MTLYWSFNSILQHMAFQLLDDTRQKMSAGETLGSAPPLHCLDEHSPGYKQTFCASSAIYRVARLSSGRAALYMLRNFEITTTQRKRFTALFEQR